MTTSDLILLALVALSLVSVLAGVLYRVFAAGTPVEARIQSARHWAGDIVDGILQATQKDMPTADELTAMSMRVIEPHVKAKDIPLVEALVRSDIERILQLVAVQPRFDTQDPAVLESLSWPPGLDEDIFPKEESAA